MSLRHRDVASIAPKDSNNTQPTNENDSDTTGETPQTDLIDINETQEANHYNTEQNTKNVELKSEVLECEDLLETTSEVQIEGTRTAKETLNDRNGASYSALEKFDEEYRWPSPSQFNREKLIEKIALSIQTPTLAKNLQIMKKLTRAMNMLQKSGAPSMAQTPQTQNLEPEAPPGTNNPGDRQSTVATTVRTDLTNLNAAEQDIHKALVRIEEITALMATPLDSSSSSSPSESQQSGDAATTSPEPTNNNPKQLSRELGKILNALFPPHGETVARNLFIIHKVANADVLRFIKEHLAKTEEGMNAAMKQMHEAGSVYDEAVAKVDTDDEDLALVDSTLQAYVSAIENAMRVCKDRLNQVMLSRSDDGNLRSNYETARDFVSKWSQEQRALKVELDATATEDLAKLAKDKETHETVDKEETGKYEKHRDESKEQIAALAARQAEVWEKIEQQVQEMGELTKQRTELVIEHMKKTEVEYQRKRHHAEYLKVNDRHTEHLELLKSLAAESIRALEFIDTRLEHLSTQVDAKSFEDGLDEMRKTEQLRFCEIYTPFVVHGNKLMASRDSRWFIAEQAATAADMNVELSAKAYDPDRPKYVEAAKQKKQIVTDLKRDVDQLVTKMEQWEETFIAVKSSLEDHGTQVDDPHEKGEKEWVAVVDGTKNTAKAVAAADKKDVDDEELVVEEERRKAKADAETSETKRADRKAKTPYKDKRKRPKSGTRRSAGSTPPPPATVEKR